MKEPLSPKSAALLVLITALLVTGDIRVAITAPPESAVTIETNISSAPPASQPLFPGQPDS